MNDAIKKALEADNGFQIDFYRGALNGMRREIAVAQEAVNAAQVAVAGLFARVAQLEQLVRRLEDA